MGTKKDTTDTNGKVERELFDLQLPDAINIMPMWEIGLPRNKVALIYEVTREKADHPAGLVRMYDSYVVSKKTKATGSPVSYDFRSKTTFADLPALKHYLLDLTALLSIKKRTRKMVNVVDLADDDEDE